MKDSETIINEAAFTYHEMKEEAATWSWRVRVILK
jgi:hypothetical protein